MYRPNHLPAAAFVCTAHVAFIQIIMEAPGTDLRAGLQRTAPIDAKACTDETIIQVEACIRQEDNITIPTG